MSAGGPDISEYYPGVFRFKAGDTVWVKDRRKKGSKVVQVVVKEQHYHPDRHPWYPYGEGYELEGELWWSCYPGCRAFPTKEQAKAARMGLSRSEFETLANEQQGALNARTS